MKSNKKNSISKTKKKFFSSKKRQTRRRSKKQSVWNMFGCARNMNGGGSGCGAPMLINGGGSCAGAPMLMNGGGSCAGDILAYPHNNISCVNNLAYTGKGGMKKNGGKKEGFSHNLNAAVMNGGTNDNMPLGAKYPSGTVGTPWTPSYSNWPGVNGIQGDKNYYMLNPYINQPDYDPSIQERTIPVVSTGGSRKYKKSRKNRKTNTFRKYVGNKVGGMPSLGIMTDIKNVFNTIRGNPQVPSPLPFEGQLTRNNTSNISKSASGIIM